MVTQKQKDIEVIAQRFRRTREVLGAHNASDEECLEEARRIYEELKRIGKSREW